MSITLKVNLVAKNATRAMRFTPEMSISEALKEINEKVGPDGGGADHGLFQRAVGTKTPPRWLEPARTLAFYDLHHEDEVLYRKRTRVQKIKMLDGAVKSIFVDDSRPARDAVETVCGKLDIKTSEEYGLLVEGKEGWVKLDKSLFEQEVGEETVLVLKKRFFFFDANIDKSDPMQVHVLYVQISDFIHDGKYVCSKDEAVMMAAVQAQIKYGDFNPTRLKDKQAKKELLELLPPQWRETKKIHEDITVEYKKLVGTTELNAKYRYIQIARALKTFGMTTFSLKIKKGRELKEELLGISRDTIVRMDGETKDVIKTYALKHVKRFASTESSVTIDFGDYEDEYYNGLTKQGREIASLISGYIDITMRIRREAGVVIEDDDTQLAEVDTVAHGRTRANIQRATALSSSGGSASFTGGEGGAAGKRVAGRGRVQAQDIVIDDLESAIRAADLLSDELGCAPSAIAHQTAMTPEQWRQQLVVSYQGVAGSCAQLLGDLSAGRVASRAALAEAAKTMLAHALKMGTAAKFAGGADDEAGGLSLLDATRNMADAIAEMLRLSNALQEGVPLTEQQAQQLREVQERYNASHAYLEAVLTGKGVVDPFSLSLLQQCGRDVALASEALHQTAIHVAESLTSEDARRLVMQEADGAYAAGQATESVVGALGGAIIRAAGGVSRQVQEDLVASSREVQSAIQRIMTSAYTATADVGRAAAELSAAVERASKLVQQAVHASSDQEMQGEVINAGKDLADSSARLIQSTFAFACNQGKDDMQDASRANTEASQAIGRIVSRLAAGTELLKDLDASIVLLQQAVRASGEGGAQTGEKTYQDHKDDLTSLCRSLTMGLKSLVAADKSNLVQVGNVAKQVAQLAQQSVDAMKCTAALAPSQGIGAQISESGAALARATLSIVQAVKGMAADPKNKAPQKQLTDSFRDATNAITTLMRAAKEGAVGEVMCDEAVEAVRKTVDDIDAALLFSSAGQLEDTSAGRSAADLQKQLGESARAAADASNALSQACAGTQEELGAAAQAFGACVAGLGRDLTASAGQIRDISLQQKLLGTGKAVAISAQALVLAGKDAQRFKGEKTDRVLAQSLESTIDSLNGLVRTSQTALAELARGAKALEEARAALANLIPRFDTLEGNAEATPRHIVEATRAVVSASGQVSHALGSNDQESTARAARYMQDAATALLVDSKGCFRLTGSQAVTAQLRKAVVAMAEQATVLLQAAKDVAAADPNDQANLKPAYDTACAELAKLSPNVNDAIKKLPGGEGLEIDQEQKDSDDLEHLAERELDKAARVIEEAAARLLASKPKVEPKAPGVKLDMSDINAIIIDGAHAIAIATSHLVKHASVCQSRRLQSAKAGSVKYRSDPLWSNGLISAAQGVVASVQSLVGSANRPKPDEEELVVTARNVASATAHLVTASRVKADDPNSEDQLNLGASAKSVAAATSKLVAAAKSALEAPVEEESTAATMDLSAVAQRNRELEYQIEIEKLEKQKERLRKQMLQVRKDKYADANMDAANASAASSILGAGQSPALRKVAAAVGVSTGGAPSPAARPAAPGAGAAAGRPPVAGRPPAPTGAARPPPPAAGARPPSSGAAARPPPPAARQPTSPGAARAAAEGAEDVARPSPPASRPPPPAQRPGSAASPAGSRPPPPAGPRPGARPPPPAPRQQQQPPAGGDAGEDVPPPAPQDAGEEVPPPPPAEDDDVPPPPPPRS
eukprot:m51a1_g10192 hypothetical protein (1719) ;mRNA; r:16827-23324